ncbi:MAG: histidine--tRNA ligase, partial [Alphaproteobacteria bacterium]
MKDKKRIPLQPVRGTHDIFGDTLRRQQSLYDLCLRLGGIFGFQLIETPIFEYAGVFHRTLGDTSDIVGKETYTFLDRGGEELTLRPEGTASVMRAIISNGMTQNLPLKLMYKGPMFRYERPQKGRHRQFHQVGVEYLGIADPYADVECIALGANILSQLGITARLEINTLGDLESRHSYRQALVTYLEKYAQDLSADSQVRLQKNPLRILDSKDSGDKKILEGAPIFDAYLTPAAQSFYERVRGGGLRWKKEGVRRRSAPF